MSADYDGGWKEALDRYLRSFLELCFPNVASQIDWSVAPVFLDQELQEVVRDAETGKSRVDKLVRVFTQDGGEQWLLIHVEVQCQAEPQLAGRLYRYHHRLEDRYDVPVVTLAVLGDDEAGWRPGPYEWGKWGCRVRFDYLTCKLLDLRTAPALATPGMNPAAIVVAAHLEAQATARDMAARKARRWELTRRLYEAGFEKADILEIYRLIDWFMTLPTALMVAFRSELAEYEESKSMAYVTSNERMARQEGLQAGLQEGRQEGRQQAKRESLLRVLEARFGEVPYTLRERVGAVEDDALLSQWLTHAATAPSLEAFLARLGQG
jgi:hypothetical protein